MRSFAFLLIVACSFVISSCASFGSRDRAFQTGVASWYGKKFQGRRTASGERFDMSELTAAHRTLPFGKIVLVKSLSTGRSVTVRINDRGPFHADRIIDLSYAAALKLDMVNKGADEVALSFLR
jgi:rare lipoprotein A